MSDVQRAGSEPAIPTASDGAIVDAGPRGIRGWLLIVAFGQTIGVLRLLIILAVYYSAQETKDAFQQYPAVAYGELVSHVFMVLLAIWTMSLFFRESSHFPRFFIGEVIAVALLPILNTVWMALVLSIQLDGVFSDYFVFESREIIQFAMAVVSALIWIPYILKSKRVRNTFVN